MNTHVHTCTRTHTRVCTRTYAHVHTHAPMHTHMHRPNALRAPPKAVFSSTILRNTSCNAASRPARSVAVTLTPPVKGGDLQSPPDLSGERVDTTDVPSDS